MAEQKPIFESTPSAGRYAKMLTNLLPIAVVALICLVAFSKSIFYGALLVILATVLFYILKKNRQHVVYSIQGYFRLYKNTIEWFPDKRSAQLDRIKSIELYSAKYSLNIQFARDTYVVGQIIVDLGDEKLEFDVDNLDVVREAFLKLGFGEELVAESILGIKTGQHIILRHHSQT